MNLFVEKIGNKKPSFDLLKYKISSELKFLIYIKVLNIQKHLEYLKNTDPGSLTRRQDNIADPNLISMINPHTN